MARERRLVLLHPRPRLRQLLHLRQARLPPSLRAARRLPAVLEGAVAALRPGGRIFIGDVRNLPLLKAFHASVQCHRAGAGTKKTQLGQVIQNDIDLESELVIDPEFFTALAQENGGTYYAVVPRKKAAPGK